MVPPESDDNLRLEIGHVLFIDIVGYSKLLNEEQKERLNQLVEIVLATTPVREATDEQLVRLPTGDGMALVFRRGGASQSGRWRQCLVGNLRPGIEGHLRGAIGDCRRGGEAAQGRAAREQWASRAVDHCGHAFQPEYRGLQRALAGKFLLQSPHRGGYPQSDRLLRGGDPARPALRARLREDVERGADSGHQLQPSVQRR